MLISVINQRKTNSAWYSLYVEFNPPKVKFIEIESKKWELSSGNGGDRERLVKACKLSAIK